MSVEECLSHPYLSAVRIITIILKDMKLILCVQYHDPDDEPSAPPLHASFFEFDHRKDVISKEELKREYLFISFKI